MHRVASGGLVNPLDVGYGGTGPLSLRARWKLKGTTPRDRFAILGKCRKLGILGQNPVKKWLWLVEGGWYVAPQDIRRPLGHGG